MFDLDLKTVTAADFSPHLDEAFAIRYDGGELKVVLVEVTEQNRDDVPAGHRAPFSIVFVGPRSPWLQQGIYEVVNAAMGAAALFLVPIMSDSQGQRYEAIFT